MPAQCFVRPHRMTPAKHTQPILIAGPTASGKSALALALARELGGTIINADSMQVYAELSILTARPTAAEMQDIPHMLYGHISVRAAYSAGRFVEEAARAISEVQASGRRPIITGGTGLYFKALLEGLSPIPPVDSRVRAHWRREAERIGAAGLHAMLHEHDPVMAARLNASDTQRIVRALEVLQSTGRSLNEWQELPGVPVVRSEDAVLLRVSRMRDDLYRRAEARFDQMMEAGALAEANALAALELDPSLPAMRALGVAPLVAAVRGELTLADAVGQAKAQTRQYIKRQETWAARYMIAWNRVSPQQIESIAVKGFAFIDR